MVDRLTRLAPLTGVVFGALTVGAIATGSETPSAGASVAKVLSYYGGHRSTAETSAVLIALAFLFLVLFAASLRSYMRRTPAAEGAAALSLAGAAVMAVGALTVTSIEYGLAHHLRELSPASAQTLSFLTNELFLIVLGGGFLLFLSSGVAILRGADLPTWLGWVGVAIGICFVIPFTVFPALFGSLIWTVVVSVLVYRRGAAAVPATH